MMRQSEKKQKRGTICKEEEKYIHNQSVEDEDEVAKNAHMLRGKKKYGWIRECIGGVTAMTAGTTHGHIETT